MNPLLTEHAIFLVLGGSFAEGIDRLGGEVERAMVVGPAAAGAPCRQRQGAAGTHYEQDHGRPTKRFAGHFWRRES